MLRSVLELSVNSTPENIWRYYDEFELRKLWESDLESYALHGPFATGTHGTMTITGLPPIQFILTHVKTHTEYWDTVTLNGLGSLVFGHEIFVRDGLRYIRHSVSFTPVGDTLHEKQLGFFKQVIHNMPDELWRLKTHVEAQ